MFKPPRSERGRSRELSSLVGFGAKPHRSPRLRSNVIIRQAAQRHRNGQRHGVAEMHNLRFFRMIRGYCVAKRRHKSIGQRADRTAPVRRNKYALFYYIGTKRQPCKAVLIRLHLLTKVRSILFPNFILTAPPPLHIIKTNFRYCFYDVRCAPHFVRRFLSDIVKTKTNICFYSPLGDEKEVFRGLYQL